MSANTTNNENDAVKQVWKGRSIWELLSNHDSWNTDRVTCIPDNINECKSDDDEEELYNLMEQLNLPGSGKMTDELAKTTCMVVVDDKWTLGAVLGVPIQPDCKLKVSLTTWVQAGGDEDIGATHSFSAGLEVFGRHQRVFTRRVGERNERWCPV